MGSLEPPVELKIPVGESVKQRIDRDPGMVMEETFRIVGPHYFLEFDVLDTQTSRFLDTPSRRALLDGFPIVPVHILYSGALKRRKELTYLLGPSRFSSTDMEGLYIKVEEEFT